MADGTTNAIADVEIGDVVLAADPETGERGPREVTHLWVHQDEVTDLELEDGSRVATTEELPFWNATDARWQRADALDPGDLLVSADGGRLAVAGMDVASVRTTTAYNLTVDGIHTYFVQLGGEAALVHNTCGDYVDVLDPRDRHHILHGDGPGSGGHQWPGQAGKSPFPQQWSGDQIIPQRGRHRYRSIDRLACSDRLRWTADSVGQPGGLARLGGARRCSHTCCLRARYGSRPHSVPRPPHAGHGGIGPVIHGEDLTERVTNLASRFRGRLDNDLLDDAMDYVTHNECVLAWRYSRSGSSSIV